ncbi:hypothetical protein [uncultured Jannaschia sp.]|uniref:hypothetical protein n=1 Tax=uncultured Jannaschia sp. TaxID=293347 RepID=UPI00260367A0|nr:hypothetical protein [uncultured Jannaschia sp.]
MRQEELKSEKHSYPGYSQNIVFRQCLASNRRLWIHFRLHVRSTPSPGYAASADRKDIHDPDRTKEKARPFAPTELSPA